MSEPTVSANVEESLYRNLFEVAGDSIIVCSDQGVVIECNQAALDLFACTREKLIGTSPIDWSPEFQPDGRRSDEMAADVFSRVKAEGMARFEWKNRRADGSPLPVDVTVRHARIDGRDLFVVISQDITERKHTEIALREAYESLHSILETTLDGFWRVDKQGYLLEVNLTYCRQSGYTQEELLRMRITDLEANERPAETAARIRRVIESGGDQFESRHRRKDGSVWDVEVSTTYRNTDGGHFFVFLRHITARKQAMNSLAASEQRFRDLVNTTDGIVWEADATTFQFTFVSEKAERLLGFSADDWTKPGFWVEHLHPDDLAWAPEFCASCTGRLEPHDFEYRFIARDGRTVWLHDIVTVVAEDGAPRWLRGIMVDVTQQKQVAAALIASEERWKFAIEGAGDGLWDWNIQTGVAYFSPRYKEMYGYGDTDFGTTSDEWSKRIHPDDAPGVFAVLQPYMDGKPGSATVEFRMLCKDGSWKWTLGRGMVVSRDADGKPVRMIGTNADITGRKQAEDTIRELAFYDALTKLPNRHLLNDRLSQAMATCTRSGCYGALIFLDLDNFKPLNDMHGHVVGDLLLVEVAERLRNSVREIDTVSRFGGDEFVVVVNGLNEERAESAAQAGFIAEKIRRTLSEPYQLTVKHGGKPDTAIEHHCTVSAGVALFLGDMTSQDEIIRWADIAMYQAKEAGRSLIRFYDVQT